jgi:hypothetical protein
MHTIKKYSNRKLYDETPIATSPSRRSPRWSPNDVRVVDHVTSSDRTTVTLAESSSRRRSPPAARGSRKILVEGLAA